MKEIPHVFITLRQRLIQHTDMYTFCNTHAV
jgi:hypothetical protein